MSDQNLIPPDGGLYGCFTVDDVAAGDGRRIAELLDWLAELEVRATFFLIPYSYANRAALHEDADLVAALRQAVEAGHECLPHGYDHDLFECGLPDLMAVREEAMMHRIARTLSREEFQLRHAHTRGSLGARLARGLQIWREAFGTDQVAGFRSGYHATCRDYYLALEDLGVRWSSSRTATPGAFRATVTDEADEIVPWVGLLPYRVGGILELPHLADYGSHIPPEDVESWVELADRHLRACRDAGAPFITVAHQAGMRCSGDPASWRDAGYLAQQRVVTLAADEYQVHYVTLSTIADAALTTPTRWPENDPYRR